MATKVLILDEAAQQYRERLAPGFPQVDFCAVSAPDEAMDAAADADVMIGLAHRLPRELIAAAPGLKWVQALTTGTDALTAEGVLPKHVVLTSTRGIHGPQMSELAFLHMIALMRNFRQMQRNQAESKWERWAQPVLEGKTIVIVGLGVLAEHLAERCKLFGMTTIGVSGGRGDAPHFDEVLPREHLAAAAARADVLMLLVPYSKATHRLVGASVIAAMKPTAYLINLARGGVLDEEALIGALRSGTIAGAGLDIFTTQPLPPDSPFWSLPNAIVTPNIGGHSEKLVDQTLSVIEPNLRAWLDGRVNDLRNRVSR